MAAQIAVCDDADQPALVAPLEADDADTAEAAPGHGHQRLAHRCAAVDQRHFGAGMHQVADLDQLLAEPAARMEHPVMIAVEALALHRSEEHTSELQSLMRISYAVFCLKKKKEKNMTKVV